VLDGYRDHALPLNHVVMVGLGCIVALCYRSSTLYQIH
jgi:hypothetical protein